MSLTPSAAAIAYPEPLYLIPGKVIVILPEPWSALSPESIDLLEKILASVHLSADAVQVLSSNSFHADQVKAYAPSFVLIFGGKTDIDIPDYECSSVDGIPTLKAARLKDLDAGAKRKLWDALKSAFHTR